MHMIAFILRLRHIDTNIHVRTLSDYLSYSPHSQPDYRDVDAQTKTPGSANVLSMNIIKFNARTIAISITIVNCTMSCTVFSPVKFGIALIFAAAKDCNCH